MRNLFAFLYRYHVFLVFILLEVIALAMFIQSNYYQSARFAISAHAWTGNFLEHFENSKDYFSLKKINQILAEENAALRSKAFTSNLSPANPHATPHQYISAKVIKNSFNKTIARSDSANAAEGENFNRFRLKHALTIGRLA